MGRDNNSVDAVGAVNQFSFMSPGGMVNTIQQKGSNQETKNLVQSGLNITYNPKVRSVEDIKRDEKWRNFVSNITDFHWLFTYDRNKKLFMLALMQAIAISKITVLLFIMLKILKYTVPYKCRDKDGKKQEIQVGLLDCLIRGLGKQAAVILKKGNAFEILLGKIGVSKRDADKIIRSIGRITPSGSEQDKSADTVFAKCCAEMTKDDDYNKLYVQYLEETGGEPLGLDGIPKDAERQNAANVLKHVRYKKIYDLIGKCYHLLFKDKSAEFSREVQKTLDVENPAEAWEKILKPFKIKDNNDYIKGRVEICLERTKESPEDRKNALTLIKLLVGRVGKDKGIVDKFVEGAGEAVEGADTKSKKDGQASVVSLAGGTGVGIPAPAGSSGLKLNPPKPEPKPGSDAVPKTAISFIIPKSLMPKGKNYLEIWKKLFVKDTVTFRITEGEHTYFLPDMRVQKVRSIITNSCSDDELKILVDIFQNEKFNSDLNNWEIFKSDEIKITNPVDIQLSGYAILLLNVAGDIERYLYKKAKEEEASRSAFKFIVPKELKDDLALWEKVCACTPVTNRGLPYLQHNETNYFVPFLLYPKGGHAPMITELKEKCADNDEDLRVLFNALIAHREDTDLSNWVVVDKLPTKGMPFQKYTGCSLDSFVVEIREYVKALAVHLKEEPPEDIVEFSVPKELEHNLSLWIPLFGQNSKVGYRDKSCGYVVPYLRALVDGKGKNKFDGNTYGYANDQLRKLYDVFLAHQNDKDWSNWVVIKKGDRKELQDIGYEDGTTTSISEYAKDISDCVKFIAKQLGIKKKLSRPPHGPGVDPAKKASSHAKDLSEKAEKSTKFLSEFRTSAGKPLYLSSKDITTESGEKVSGFKIKMGKQLSGLYIADDSSELTQVAKKAVAELPEPILEQTVDIEGVKTQPFNSPLLKEADGSDGYEKYHYNEYFLRINYCYEFWPGCDYISGQYLLQETEKRFNPDGDLNIHQISQAASQTNGLESTGTHHSRLDWQGGDASQGPTCCSQFLASWIKREAMYNDGTLPDSAAALLDALEDAGVIEPVDAGGDTYYEVTDGYHDKKYHSAEKVFYMNGYIQPWVLNEDGRKELAIAIMNHPAGYMSQRCLSDEEVAKTVGGGSRRVPATLSFGAAFSYQDRYCPADEGLTCAMNYMWVYDQYENIIKDAIRASSQLPYDDHWLVIVHLTGLGQGVFNNPPGIHQVALNKIFEKYRDKLRGSNIIIIAHWAPWKDTSAIEAKIKYGFSEISRYLHDKSAQKYEAAHPDKSTFGSTFGSGFGGSGSGFGGSGSGFGVAFGSGFGVASGSGFSGGSGSGFSGGFGSGYGVSSAIYSKYGF